jgi:hypothetical protein
MSQYSMTNKIEKYFSPEDIEKQEDLNLHRLNSLISKTDQYSHSFYPDRPAANFIDLMEWTERNFRIFLTDKVGLNKLVNNRIVIDGSFMQFCEERGVEITCLGKDSIISWSTEHNFEKFFVQGVFLIKNKNMEFLHAALFHKGNQNEDEISFFIICSEKNQLKYIEFRNEFDKWVLDRDRSNLRVYVVDGEDFPYTKDNTWEDLFLPEDLKKDIRSMVENFLASKDFYFKNRIPWKRGILLYGAAGCGKTSIIRTVMSMYNFKPVTVAAGADDEAVHKAFSYAEEQSPALLYFEDLDSLLEKSLDPSSFLNLMDGISAKNGLLVMATANEVKKLKANVIDRPSRFDRKYEIPLPNAEMAYIYLKRWFGNFISTQKCKELAKYTTKHQFSYAYLKELYISSMFEALSYDRKSLIEKDVSIALNRLIKEKNLLNGGSINMDKYFKG